MSLAKPRFGGTAAPRNYLLAHLPAAARDHLEGALHRVMLPAGMSIFQANEPLPAAYFPESGVISLTASLPDGETLQVGVVGRDGMVGFAFVPGVSTMPYAASVQVSGTALRLHADGLREAARQFEPVHALLGRYAYALFAQGVQNAACGTFHSMKQRSARWILMLHDLADADTFPVTHNVLALMLGARRPSVTVIARALQRAGLVDYRHGHLTILNRRGLEAAACECYRLIRDEQMRLLGY